MSTSMDSSARALLSLLWLGTWTGCTEEPRELPLSPDASPTGADASTTDAEDESDTSTGGLPGGSSGDESTSGAPPAPQCASVEQSTVVDERPSDIIVIADDAVDRVFVRDNITNLLPGMETEGVDDAAVTLIVSGNAPAGSDDRFECGAWACRGASTYPDFTVVDMAVPSNAVLSTLLDARASWTPGLRENSWKHVWVMTVEASDTQLDNDALLAELATIATGETGFIIHAVVLETAAEPDDAGYAGLATQTGGAYSHGDYNLADFQDPMIERIQSTALACAFDIPPPPKGLVFARDEVNVTYEDALGPLTIGYVESAADCPGAGDAWYYDDPVDPSTILMCPGSCARFEAGVEASVEIEFGCATIPAA